MDRVEGSGYPLGDAVAAPAAKGQVWTTKVKEIPLEDITLRFNP